MLNTIFKITLIMVLGIIAIFLWLGMDQNDQTDDYIVSIEYDCRKLNEYEVVPKEVTEECSTRNNK